ncbi:MAG: sugar-binding domain-containing protein, partial [Rikenellaceae bacterium]
MRRRILTALLLLTSLTTMVAQAQKRVQTTLKEGWEFRRADEAKWSRVSVPHDWAIYGPFDKENDLQIVKVTQNGEKVATQKTGRTGGLPYMGRGEYRLTLNLTPSQIEERNLVLLFDGAMSEAVVKLNGVEVGSWPYGYNAFTCDITQAAKVGDNLIEVSLNNEPQSSRWYPGAGLYRNVHLISTERVHIPVWGTYITTPYVGEDYASVHLRVSVEGIESGDEVSLVTQITDEEGRVVAQKHNTQKLNYSMPAEQHFTVENPELWSPESPTLY